MIEHSRNKAHKTRQTDSDRQQHNRTWYRHRNTQTKITCTWHL